MTICAPLALVNCFIVDPFDPIIKPTISWGTSNSYIGGISISSSTGLTLDVSAVEAPLPLSWEPYWKTKNEPFKKTFLHKKEHIDAKKIWRSLAFAFHTISNKHLSAIYSKRGMTRYDLFHEHNRETKMNLKWNWTLFASNNGSICAKSSFIVRYCIYSWENSSIDRYVHCTHAKSSLSVMQSSVALSYKSCNILCVKIICSECLSFLRRTTFFFSYMTPRRRRRLSYFFY